MNELSYKGYTVEACPEQLAESGRWSTNYVIWENGSDHVEDMPVVGLETFETEQEAIQRCFDLAKQIIDARIVDKPDVP